VALGNNDSDCGDYKLDAHSEFFVSDRRGRNKGLSFARAEGALESFSVGGYYNVRCRFKMRAGGFEYLFMSGRYRPVPSRTTPRPRRTACVA